MSSDWIHFLATLIWGVYGVVVGLAALYSPGGFSLWIGITVVTAIVGNSAHLVAFAWSKKGQINITSTQAKT